MDEKQPLSWKKIFLCAILAGPIALGISIGLLLLGGTAVERLTDLDFGGYGFLVVMIMALIAYLPLTALVAFVLSLYLVSYRLMAHSMLAALLSLPVTMLFAGLILAFG